MTRIPGQFKWPGFRVILLNPVSWSKHFDPESGHYISLTRNPGQIILTQNPGQNIWSLLFIIIIYYY